nr:hypothetical protein [Lentzea atacamensis]
MFPLGVGDVGSGGHRVHHPDRPAILALVRLTRTEPGLRAVWLEAHRQAEPVFAEALARRSGLAAPDLAVVVQAAMINAALRAAVEHHAFHADPVADDAADGAEAAVSEALLLAARVFSG